MSTTRSASDGELPPSCPRLSDRRGIWSKATTSIESAIIVQACRPSCDPPGDFLPRMESLLPPPVEHSYRATNSSSRLNGICNEIIAGESLPESPSRGGPSTRIDINESYFCPSRSNSRYGERSVSWSESQFHFATRSASGEECTRRISNITAGSPRSLPSRDATMPGAIRVQGMNANPVENDRYENETISSFTHDNGARSRGCDPVVPTAATFETTFEDDDMPILLSAYRVILRQCFGRRRLVRSKKFVKDCLVMIIMLDFLSFF